LDHILTEGAAGGSITIIAAGSGAGKSTYVGKLRNGLLNRRVPLIEFNTELSLAQSVDRYVCSKYKVPLKELHPKYIEEDDTKKEFVFNLIEKETESIKKNKLYRYLHDSVITLNDIENYIKESIKAFGSSYGVVIIDLLSMVKEFGISKNGSRADNIENAMDQLNHISKKYNVHIIGTVQIKRPPEKVSIKTIEDIDKLIPTENELKSSSAYMERARILLTLFRPYYYAQKYLKEDDPQLELLQDEMILQVLKQSQGEVGNRLKYLFDGEHFRVIPIKEDLESET
jgi:replicative DNA helicase